MTEEIYDPTSEYVNVFKESFSEECKKTFDKIAKESNVDVVSNRKLCKEIYKAKKELENISSKITRWWTAAFVCCFMIAIALFVIYTSSVLRSSINVGAVIIIAPLVIVLIIVSVYEHVKKLKGDRALLESEIAGMEKEAWQQMQPLNQLFDDDIFIRMMAKTIPQIELDPYFTTQRLEDFKKVYGIESDFNSDGSVVYLQSGAINGNPFVIYRIKDMYWGSKKYVGTKTIHWKEREKGPDGKYRTVERSETLYASVESRYPVYFEDTRLIYGNIAAPDLVFNRKQSGFIDKLGTRSFKRKIKALCKKTRKLQDKDFAIVGDESFEAAFDTTDRNNNQQFALLFTPMAQESMMNLLKNSTDGYGDDFDFQKDKMKNTITSNHMQSIDLDVIPKQYQNFDYDKIKEDFYNVNTGYFRAVYFNIAPLLCVPMYRQIRSQKDIHKSKKEKEESCHWEHEALANYLGDYYFKAASCDTQCILKTTQYSGRNGRSTIMVSAYGYTKVPQVTKISVYGGDGRYHDVPVHWDDYQLVVGHGDVDIKEVDYEDKFDTQKKRMKYRNDMLDENGMSVFRRHIMSKVE